MVTRRHNTSSPRLGWWVGLGGVAALAAAMAPLRDHVSSTTPALLLLAPVATAGYLGGRRVAIWSAVAAVLAFDLVFLPPFGSLRITFSTDAVAIVVFSTVALATGALVAQEATRRREAVEEAARWAELTEQLRAAERERDRLEAETRRVAVLEEIDRQRSALLRAVSHDLRTPLGTIRAVSSDLLAGTGFDRSTTDELLALVVQEAERLDRIVTNLLHMSRIEAGALAPDVQPTDLDDIVQAVTARTGRLLAHHQLIVRIPANLPAVMVDFTQFDLVLTNLLENTARHAPPGTTVYLEASSNGNCASIHVHDDGPGVDPLLANSVFEPFRSGSGSTGIGLAICRAIVEAHGGTISLGEPHAGGAHFVVTVPVAGINDDSGG
jgi:two-component system sensor histidine kinase KdpD